jgi:hypothetical protein
MGWYALSGADSGQSLKADYCRDIGIPLVSETPMPVIGNEPLARDGATDMVPS